MLFKTNTSRRQAALAELADTRLGVDRRVQALQKDLDHARTRAQHLRASCDEAYATCARLELELAGVRQEFDRARDELEREIANLADSRLDAFLVELQRLRDSLHISHRQDGPINHATGERAMTSNAAAVKAVVAAIVAARDRALALKLEDVADVGAALAEIRAGIPTVEQAEARS
jgi:hypothetical protein